MSAFYLTKGSPWRRFSFGMLVGACGLLESLVTILTLGMAGINLTMPVMFWYTMRELWRRDR